MDAFSSAWMQKLSTNLRNYLITRINPSGLPIGILVYITFNVSNNRVD